MFEPLIKAIQDAVVPTTISIDAKEYVTKSIYFPPPEPSIDRLLIHSLSGLVQYLSGPGQTEASDPPFIHVVDHKTVDVWGLASGRHRDREHYLRCEYLPAIESGKFQFGSYYELFQFNTQIQALFEDTPARSQLLQVTGNIRDENIKTAEDDGVTQTVNVRSGINRLAATNAPNPIALKPYRTFTEVNQPESLFVFRLSKGRDGELPQCALIEADGGRWKREAIDRIVNWLRSAIAVANLDIPIIG
jgi:hypothetical protein